MKIAFFSEDNFGLSVLSNLVKKHSVEIVVCPTFDNFIYKKLEVFCKQSNITFYRTSNINDNYVSDKLKDLKIDVLVSVHCSKTITPAIFNIPKYGAINSHPSLLPKYRGMSPQHWPIINGDKETGITVHFMSEKVDTGNIQIGRASCRERV